MAFTTTGCNGAEAKEEPSKAGAEANVQTEGEVNDEEESEVNDEDYNRLITNWQGSYPLNPLIYRQLYIQIR